MIYLRLLSGDVLHNYGSHEFNDFPFSNMLIFHNYVTLPEGHQNILGKYHNNSVTNLERETSGASYASTFIQITKKNRWVYGTFYIILQYTLFFFHFWAPEKIAHRTSLNRIFNFRGLIWRGC